MLLGKKVVVLKTEFLILTLQLKYYGSQDRGKLEKSFAGGI